MVNAVIRHLVVCIFHDSWYVRDESGCCGFAINAIIHLK
jgi:hypothetical protein